MLLSLASKVEGQVGKTQVTIQPWSSPYYVPQTLSSFSLGWTPPPPISHLAVKCVGRPEGQWAGLGPAGPAYHGSTMGKGGSQTWLAYSPLRSVSPRRF